MTKKELIDKTNLAIAELVYDKKELRKAYNYYNGVRDADLFRYLEENFGLGSPTSIEFTPLIRKHIDTLVGEYLGVPILPKIQCKDEETIKNIGRDKQLKIISEVHSLLTKSLKNDILNFINNKDVTDTLIESQISDLVEDINNSFVSEYEIAALNVLEYVIQSRNIDLKTASRTLLLDLLISGFTFYKVEPTKEGTNLRVRPLCPLDVFPDLNIESPYIKDSYRIVVRNWMTKSLILNKYGKELSKEDLDKIKTHWTNLYNSSNWYLDSDAVNSTGILADTELASPPGYPENINGSSNEFIPVYEVEWIETDKNFVMQRYETVRVGDDIFILKGESENVIRSKDNPSQCGLSVNGVYFLNRNNKPYSLILTCASLQDRYDILNFYMDRLIASSGTTGDFVDISLLPTFLGSSMPERLLKFIAYKKGGIAPIDSSQPGRLENGQTAPNTIFNGFDDTVKVQAIQAIQLAIQSIEETVSSITGVFRERLNGIQQRDAVSNIKQGINNSFVITKQYYHLMDLVINEILSDCLNIAKIVFKKGLTGTIILGDKYQKIFTALPEHFTHTDYDIRIITSSDIMKDLEYLRLTIPDLAKANIISPDIIIDALTAKSVTELKTKAKASMRKQEEKNNQLLQLSLKLQETEQLLKQVSQLLEKASKKVEQLHEENLKIEQLKVELKYKVDWYKALTERTYKNRELDIQNERTQMEKAQLYDGNPYNDKVRLI